MDIPFSALYDTSGVPVDASVVDIGNTMIMTKEQIHDSPSRKEGIDAATENLLRLKACEMIHGVLTQCGVDRMVICTAQIYLHRYYCQRSITTYHYKVIHSFNVETPSFA